MQAQPFHSLFHAQTMARVNEHHNNYGRFINSDTVLWLAWIFMNGPIQWICLAGGRPLDPWEVYAMFVMWRELSVMLGCKWVPNTPEEFEDFRLKFEQQEQQFAPENVIYAKAIMNSALYSVPVFLRPFGRKCIIAILDPDVRCCLGYEPEFNPALRTVLLYILKGWGWFQYNVRLPRFWPRQLTPLRANPDGRLNFPPYTFPATPYYVAQTNWNQYGPIAMLNRLRGLPLPDPRFGSNGVMIQSMGTARPTTESQLNAENRVMIAAADLKRQPFGYRPHVKFQPFALVVTQDMLPGYGDAANGYTPEECADGVHTSNTNQEVCR
ncbi:MAG: hypothetical protein Q9163_002676 [Psora crenata]